MGVFVSYSSLDKDAATRLTEDLQDAEEQVWLDERLGGGEAWWRAILEQIRGCEVFIFALSQNSLQSKPCQAELRYAQDLGLPILPVQVGPVESMQLNPLATVQAVPYRTSSSTAAMRLLSALHRARTQRQPLPSPLPAEPPVPFEYLMRLYTTIVGTDQLSPRDQVALVAQLQFGLREDGDSDAARKDIVKLLTTLRDREDVTYRTRTDVDAVLASIDAAAHRERAPQPPGLTATTTSEPVAGSRLPTQLTSFVGREAELTDVRQLVCDHRLVTLTGAGGVGKTRLAVELAGQLADRFGDGVWWVDLAPITDPDLVAVAVARTLDQRDQPGRSTIDALTRFIADRDMLVVLDNCEHLLDACAALTVALLGACARLRILATSREPIGVPGEATWRTPSLSLGDEAIELFTQRARLARPDFGISGDNAAVVVKICSRLDGVPLAIELAAARVRALSLTEIADGLRDRFRLLTGGARTALPRQQTLLASVDWSHALLAEPERVLFRRLAVFMGGFDLDAVHAVAGGADVPRYQILDELTSLVDKSLVVAEDSGHGTRYRLLETVRQYALDKLGESGEIETVRIGHRDHYTALAAPLDTPSSGGHEQRLEQAESEIDNLRAAFAWSQEHADIDLALQLASSLQPLWLSHGRSLEGLAWFNAVLTDDSAAAPAARARALADKVQLDAFTGAYFCMDQAGEALAIARELDDPALLARVLNANGATCSFAPPIALPHFQEAIELARVLGDNWRLSEFLGAQAWSAFIAGDPTALRAAAEEGRDLADASGYLFMSRMCRWCIGCAQLLTADLAAGAAQSSEVAADAQAAHDTMWEAYSLVSLGTMLAFQGDTSGARAAAEAAIECATDVTGLGQGASFGTLVYACLAAGDVAAALAADERAGKACDPAILVALTIINVYPLAQLALAKGDVSAAHRSVDDALAAATGVHRMVLLGVRARVAIAQGDFEQADRDAHDALAIAAETKTSVWIPDIIECLAGLANDSGGHREAARLFGSAEAIRERTGQVRFTIYDADYTAAVGALREAMDTEDFEMAWAEGGALSTDEAIASALRDVGHGHAQPAAGRS
jgi:predicted ATPase